MGTIQPPDGIHYVVAGTRQEVRPAPECGFNDFGVANPGIFNVETRQYSEYQNGQLIRSWAEDVSVFAGCQNV